MVELFIVVCPDWKCPGFNVHLCGCCLCFGLGLKWHCFVNITDLRFILFIYYFFNELIKMVPCQNDCWDTLQKTKQKRKHVPSSTTEKSVRLIRSSCRSSVWTIISLAVSWMPGAMARRWLQPAECSTHRPWPRERRGHRWWTDRLIRRSHLGTFLSELPSDLVICYSG